MGQVGERACLSMPPVRKCWPSGNQAQAEVFSLWCCAVCMQSPVQASHSRTCAKPRSHAESVPPSVSGPHGYETAASTILLVLVMRSPTCSAHEGLGPAIGMHTGC